MKDDVFLHSAMIDTSILEQRLVSQLNLNFAGNLSAFSIPAIINEYVAISRSCITN